MNSPFYEPDRISGLVNQGPLEHRIEEFACWCRSYEPVGCLLEGGEVGDDLQADDPAEIGMVGQMGGEAVIVGT